MRPGSGLRKQNAFPRAAATDHSVRKTAPETRLTCRRPDTHPATAAADSSSDSRIRRTATRLSRRRVIGGGLWAALRYEPYGHGHDCHGSGYAGQDDELKR